jgi:sulfofructose kinase
MAEVICVGGAVLDQTWDVPALAAANGTIVAHSYRQAGAGSAANAAVAASRLGGKAVLWTRLGDDASGELIVADLVRHRVDVGDIRRVAGAQSPMRSVLAAADGQRQTTRFDGIGLADDADWLPLGRIQTTGAVLVEPVWRAGAQAALDAARERRVPSVLAAGSAPKARCAELARAAGHVVFSPAGLARFTGADDRDEALAMAAQAVGTLVGVTSGIDGLSWIGDDGLPRHEPAPAIDPVDPTGAWDCFCGALALALAEEKGFRTAVRFAVTAAGLAAAVPGGRHAMPERRAVWQRLEADHGPLADDDG